MEEDELRDAILLVFANKQDLPNAMSASEITEKLGLSALRGRKVIKKINVIPIIGITFIFGLFIFFVTCIIPNI